MQVIKGLLNGEIKVNEYVMDKMYKCALCGYCLWRCPPGVKTTDAIKAARAYLVEHGSYPWVVDRVYENLSQGHSIYSMPDEARAEWVDYANLGDIVKTGKKAEVVYFPGCATSFTSRAMNIASMSSQILEGLNLEWTILGKDEWCCGNPLTLSGKMGLFEDIVKHNVKAIHSQGAKMVVTSCSGCYRTFLQEYPRVMGSLGFEVYHMTQLLEKMIDLGRISFSEKLDMRVTYHDPCELGRFMGVYEAPRKVLRTVPGVNLVELPHNRSITACCGGGGLLKATNPDIALKLGFKKLEEARNLNVETIVSSCPSCKLNILDAIAAHGDKVQMLDVTEIVGKALKLSE